MRAKTRKKIIISHIHFFPLGLIGYFQWQQKFSGVIIARNTFTFLAYCQTFLCVRIKAIQQDPIKNNTWASAKIKKKTSFFCFCHLIYANDIDHIDQSPVSRWSNFKRKSDFQTLFSSFNFFLFVFCFARILLWFL